MGRTGSREDGAPRTGGCSPDGPRSTQEHEEGQGGRFRFLILPHTFGYYFPLCYCVVLLPRTVTLLLVSPRAEVCPSSLESKHLEGIINHCPHTHSPGEPKTASLLRSPSALLSPVLCVLIVFSLFRGKVFLFFRKPVLFSWPCCGPSPASVALAGRPLGAPWGDKLLPEGERAHFLLDTPTQEGENSLEKSRLSGVREIPGWKKMAVEDMGWGANEKDSRTAGHRGGSEGERLWEGL